MSSSCQALIDGATAGVAASLRAVDCVTAEATTVAFSRLFGTHGALLPALTLLLTLYIAIFALMLLTGRSRLGIGALTPRMITLGLVLTFTTSSVAYQGVVWNLAVGAPDQIAGVLMSVKGSASQIFADRIDLLFNAIAEAAASAVQPGAPRTGQGAFTPANLMWLSALMLMLGTVGVLVTARILLAILLSLGPVFITFVLFDGTRGLFAGWLRGVTLTAFTPLIAALAGATVVEFAVPVVAALRSVEEGIDGRAAMALFVIAAVYCAIMAVAIRVSAAIVSGWRVFGLVGDKGKPSPAAAVPPAPRAPAISPASVFAPQAGLRGLGLAAGPSGASLAAGAGSATTQTLRSIVIPATAPGGAGQPPGPSRARGVGSRFSGRAASRGALLK